MPAERLTWRLEGGPCRMAFIEPFGNPRRGTPQRPQPQVKKVALRGQPHQVIYNSHGYVRGLKGQIQSNHVGPHC